MSLRFLTRRRDRDRSPHRPTTTNSSTSTTTSAPANVALPISNTNAHSLTKGKLAVPAEVQIISWDPRDLEASGREVYIRSRTDHTSAFTTTPVYHTFTAQRASALTTNDNTPSTSQIQSDLFAKPHPRARPRTAPRPTAHRPPPQWGESFFDPPSSYHDSATTPRSEHVEELESSLLAPRAQHDSKQSLPVRLASKARRAKSRSHHSTADGYESEHNSFSGVPSSLPSTSRSPFSSLHRNASAQSLASLLSNAGIGSKDAPTQADNSNSASALLARIPSTRRLRRNQNASSADMGSSAAPQETTNRSRSASLSSLAPKFLRKDGAQPPPTPSKSRTRGAPPSAWKTEVGFAAEAGSSYSSENEAASSSGHGEATTTLGVKHARRGSADTTASHQRIQASSSSTNNQLLAPPLPAAEVASHRMSTYTTRSAASLAQSTPHAHPSPQLPSKADSPVVSGLPLPLSTPTSPTLVTAQLFKRLGPPPVGLPAHCFNDRVTLIQHYVQSQVPPTPCPKSPTAPGLSTSQRLSLPPPPRNAALADEFDKLECQAEQQMLALSSGIEVLQLQAAFLEARRRCGVDDRRSWFQLNSVAAASAGGQALGLGLSGGLGVDERVEVGASLKPAPRRRRAGVGRRPITAPEAPFQSRGGDEATTRPDTAAATGGRTLGQLCEADSSLAASVGEELFTPASFSAKPTSRFRRGSSDRDSASSHTHRSSSSMSPLLFGHPHAQQMHAHPHLAGRSFGAGFGRSDSLDTVATEHTGFNGEDGVSPRKVVDF